MRTINDFKGADKSVLADFVGESGINNHTVGVVPVTSGNVGVGESVVVVLVATKLVTEFAI